MKIIVKHMEMNSETGAVEGYTPVAIVNAIDIDDINEALEYAYRWTNNVMGSWSIQEEVINGYENGDLNHWVTVLVKREDGMGLRSSMMGDRFEVDGVDYRVALAGFKEVEKVA